MKSTCIYMSQVMLLAPWRPWSSVEHTVFYPSVICKSRGKDNTCSFCLFTFILLSVYPLYSLCIPLSPCPSFYPHPFFLHTFIHKHTYRPSLDHTFSLFRFCYCLAFYLCFYVSDWCPFDPCRTLLFYDSGPLCCSNLGQHHRADIGLWYM